MGSPESPTAAIIIGIFGVFIIIVGGLSFYFYKQEQNKRATQSSITPDHPAFKNQGINNSIVTHAQQPGQNGGAYYYQQPGSNKPPTTILPMASVAPQQQSIQEQMQGIQFSSHPRPNFVTTAHGGEPEIINSSEPPSGAPRTPQTQWQPTPFIPPTCPSDSPGIPSPRPHASHSPIVAVVSSAAAESPRDPQKEMSHRSLSSSKPLPALPPIPRNTRLSPGIGSPHTILTT